MWLLSLKMALRPNKRSILAMMGVAVCLMYVSGTTALVDGLKEGKERFMEERTEQYYICSKDDSLSSLFTPEEVEIIGNEGVVWGVVTPVIIFDMDTFLLGFDDASNMMCSCPLVENSTGVLLGPLLPEEEGNSTNLSTSSGERTIMIEGRLDNLTSQGTMFFPPDWIVSTPEHVRDCGGQSAGVFSFFITTDIASLDTAGLVVQPLISKDAFFVESMGQVESALWLLTTMAGMITLVVIYNLMHVEIMARSKDIRILHGMGGSDRWIMGVFTLEAASASFVGGVMGIILGIVGANLIVSGFTLIGYTMLLSPHATMGSTLVPLGIALGAGILGGGTVSYLSIRRKRGGTS